MNLLPATEKEGLKRGFRARSVSVASLLVAASSVAGLILLLPAFFLSLSNYSKIGQESYFLSKKNDGSVEAMLTLPSEINSKSRFMQTTQSGISARASLFKILGFVPQEVSITSITFLRDQEYKEKPGSLYSLAGVAASRDALLAFAGSLKESGEFAMVDIPVSNLTKNKDLPFSMNILISSQ